jgi:hypothetical protein
MRFDIDPFGSYSDAEIWTVLELMRIIKMENGLSYLLAEGGQSMRWIHTFCLYYLYLCYLCFCSSAGERWLPYLARALSPKSKIFVLDEATAGTLTHSFLIQPWISKFYIISNWYGNWSTRSTHYSISSGRCNSVDYRSYGYLQEYDEPTRLAATTNSIFTKLLHNANIRLLINSS